MAAGDIERFSKRGWSEDAPLLASRTVTCTKSLTDGVSCSCSCAAITDAKWRPTNDVQQTVQVRAQDNRKWRRYQLPFSRLSPPRCLSSCSFRSEDQIEYDKRMLAGAQPRGECVPEEGYPVLVRRAQDIRSKSRSGIGLGQQRGRSNSSASYFVGGMLELHLKLRLVPLRQPKTLIRSRSRPASSRQREWPCHG